MKRNIVGMIVGMCGVMVCATGCTSAHPDSSVQPWRVFCEPGQPLEAQFDVSRGRWSLQDGVLTSDEDGALWTKADYENFALDFEYKLDVEANSGVLLYCQDTKRWIPNTIEIQLLDDAAPKWAKDPDYMKNASLYGHGAPIKANGRPAGEWNRMTIYAQGQHIRIINNGELVLDENLSKWTDAKKNPDGTKIPPWLSRPWADIPPKGKLGFQGMHGKSKPYFRNIRIRPL